MAFGTIVMTRLAVTHGLKLFESIAGGGGACNGFGLLNGLLVTGLRLPPFIVPLGTLNIAFALTHIVSNEETIANLPRPLTFFGETLQIGTTAITYGSVLALGLALVTWFALAQTVGGRHIYATGNNPAPARLPALPPPRLLIALDTTARLR